MASNQEHNAPFPRLPANFIEFLPDEPIPVLECTENQLKPKRNYLKKGTGLLRYRMKPNQNFRKQPVTSTNLPKDKTDIKFLPDITKQALKRPHDNWESFVDTLSNVSNLNDSTVSREELLQFERLERETANTSISSSHELEHSENPKLVQIDRLLNEFFPTSVHYMEQNPIEFNENGSGCEILCNNPVDVDNSDKEIEDIFESVHEFNSSDDREDSQPPGDYNDEDMWKKLMEMTKNMYETTLGITSCNSQSSTPTFTSQKEHKSVSSQCSLPKKEIGVQVSEETNPLYNKLQDRLEKIEAEIGFYKLKCTDLNNQIKAGDAEKDRLKTELDRLVLAESQLKKKVQEIGQRKVKLNHLHENDKKLVNKKAEECVILKKEIQSVKDDLLEKEKQYKAIENKNKKLIVEVASLKKKMDLMKQQISSKANNKVDKATSTRDLLKLNKELREQPSIDKLTIQDVVPRKPIPNHLTHNVGTQVFIDEIRPTACLVTVDDKQVDAASLRERSSSAFETAVKCDKGHPDVGSDVISSPDKTGTDPAANCTPGNLVKEKSDDSNSKEFISPSAQNCQDQSLSQDIHACAIEKTNLKSKKKRVLNSPVLLRKEMSDGGKLTIFLNGTKKFISADGNQVKVLYVNGDILKKDYAAETESYYFSSHNSWQTKHSNGSKTLEFSNGQTERYYPNGTKVIEMPDGKEITLFKTGIMKWILPDGTTHIHTQDGKRLSIYKNGQKEIQLKMITVRQYPDGTTSIRYPNGTVETRYWNGRRRIKNKFGVLISDTGLI